MQTFFANNRLWILLAAAAVLLTVFAVMLLRMQGVKKLTDLSYGSHAAQAVDVYLPKAKKEQRSALVLYIHGGAWSGGDKGSYTVACIDSAKEGYAAATVNYRMIGDGATWEEMLEDITLAMALVKNTAAEHGIQLEKVALTGASAGAHLSMLYAHRNADESPLPVAFCASQCGPTDFTDVSMASECEDPAAIFAILSGLVGRELSETNYNEHMAVLADASPITHIKADAPPTLLAHGELDPLVPFSQATVMFDALQAAGVPSDLVEYPNSGHGLDSDPDAADEYTRLFELYRTEYFGY